jgi:hypothetical protein
MKPKLLFGRICGLIIFFCAANGYALADLKKTEPPYRIVSIKAFLFFEHTGTLSENIIDNPKYGPGALWNSIIGAGSAGSPSHATMVIVEIAGKPRGYSNNIRVEFTAMKGDKVDVRRSQKIGGLNEMGHYFSALWIYDTGCAPLLLTAKLSGASDKSVLEKKIEFSCGE